jgi:N-acetylglucosaminyl-diphospho-decaprenol L-rhamnosyltransferase
MDIRAGAPLTRLAVVIVNYRTAELACQSLASLAPELASRPGSVVRVVDNDSGDGSLERIARFVEEQGFGGWAQVAPAGRNGGFSAGNNVALRALLAEGRHDEFLLLNPDAWVLPGAIDALVSRMESDPGIGIVGSRLENPDGSLQRAAFRFPSPGSELERAISLGPITRLMSNWAISFPPADEPHRCDWVAGASLLVRREVLEKVGLLDEGYFLYFEEVDLCLRASRAGFSCWHEPRSRVVHLEGQATGVTDPRNARRRLPTYWFDSRRRFFLKNFGRARTAAADASWLAGCVVGAPGRALRKAVRGKVEEAPRRMLLDFTRHSVFVRGFGW